MTITEPAMGDFSITVRLFNRVAAMPRDQQLILLRQLVGDQIAKFLFKRIVDMTEAQQILLLEQMEQLPQAELPVRTVNIEESEASMRETPRKQCLIRADYKIQDRRYKSYILDISIGGVFIETDAKYSVGKELLLNFSLPNHSKPFTFHGKIAWSSTKGFGVKFDTANALHSDALKSFVNPKE